MYVSTGNVCLVIHYKTNICRLVTFQKRAIRIINKSKFDALLDPILSLFGPGFFWSSTTGRRGGGLSTSVTPRIQKL